MILCGIPYVDLARDGGGDESGAAFLEELDGAAGGDHEREGDAEPQETPGAAEVWSAATSAGFGEAVPKAVNLGEDRFDSSAGWR